MDGLGNGAMAHRAAAHRAAVRRAAVRRGALTRRGALPRRGALTRRTALPRHTAGPRRPALLRRMALPRRRLGPRRRLWAAQRLRKSLGRRYRRSADLCRRLSGSRSSLSAFPCLSSRVPGCFPSEPVRCSWRTACGKSIRSELQFNNGGAIGIARHRALRSSCTLDGKKAALSVKPKAAWWYPFTT